METSQRTTAPTAVKWHGAPALARTLTRIDTLTPDPRNARFHDSRNLKAIADSYRRFGQQRPILVADDGTVVAGNGQLEAARSLGWSHIAAIASNLRRWERTAFSLADNRTAELAVWDRDTLAGLLQELQAQDQALLAAVGFGEDLAAFMNPPEAPPGIDDVPLPPDAAKTRGGDVYVLGDHRLLCGDAGEAADVNRLLVGAAIHLVHTDPPYNVGVASRSNNAIAVSGHRPIGQQGMDMAIRGETHATTGKLRPKDRPLVNDFISDEEFARLLRLWFGNIQRVLEPGRGFYIWGGYSNIWNYPNALKESELYFSQMVIWVKEHPVLTRKDFMGNHEWCFYGWREGAAHEFFGAANVPDVWELRPQSGGETGCTWAPLGDGLILADRPGPLPDAALADPQDAPTRVGRRPSRGAPARRPDRCLAREEGSAPADDPPDREACRVGPAGHALLEPQRRERPRPLRRQRQHPHGRRGRRPAGVLDGDRPALLRRHRRAMGEVHGQEGNPTRGKEKEMTEHQVRMMFKALRFLILLTASLLWHRLRQGEDDHDQPLCLQQQVLRLAWDFGAKLGTDPETRAE